jgi:hypothetical protein
MQKKNHSERKPHVIEGRDGRTAGRLWVELERGGAGRLWIEADGFTLQAVAHATRLAEARSVGAEATAAKLKKQRQKKKRKQDPENLRKRALADAVNKQISKKKEKTAARSQGVAGKSRFVVIPGAVGRESAGPNALQALRNKLAISK